MKKKTSPKSSPNTALAVAAGALLCAGLTLVASPASAQPIFRCMVDGQPVYQQGPCGSASQRGERLQSDPRLGELVPAPELPPPSRPARAERAEAAQPASLATAAAEPAPGPTAIRTRPKPQTAMSLEAEAEACMDWYRPMLREPQAAYRTTPRKEGQELIMMIHAPDGQGGFQSRAASCEFGEDGLDTAATQVHAQRRGWKALAKR